MSALEQKNSLKSSLRNRDKDIQTKPKVNKNEGIMTRVEITETKNKNTRKYQMKQKVVL